MRYPAGVEHGEASGAGDASVAWHGVRRCFGVSGGAVMGAGMARAWQAVGGGRSPMAMAGGGGEWGPHTKESIRCIPQSETLKNQKESLLRSHRTARFIRFRQMQFPEK